MPLLFWDASALVKRYAPELGSDTDNALFASSPPFASTAWAYAETFTILLRRRNGGLLDPADLALAVSALQAKVVNGPRFDLLSIDDTVVFASPAAMQRHNLNATDAAILTLLIAARSVLPADRLPLVVIAADQRLVRAAGQEGFSTLNPEQFLAADVASFLASL